MLRCMPSKPLNFSSLAVAGRRRMFPVANSGNVSLCAGGQSWFNIRGQRTKAQPTKGQVNDRLIVEQSSTVDPDVTLYHRPTHHSVNINLQQQCTATLDDVGTNVQSPTTTHAVAPRSSLGADADERLKDALRLIHRQQTSAQLDDKDSASVHSIDEILSREIKPNLELSQLPGIYARLSKLRLTVPRGICCCKWQHYNYQRGFNSFIIIVVGLVVVTTMSGYAMAPGIFEPGTFLLCCLGTAMTSAAANTVNQFLEVPYDAQMNRTKSRPIVKGQVSPLHAICFAIFSGAVGSTVLLVGVNPLTAALGVFNLALYTMVYTPMKRLSIANTWVGSIVGAVPPLMGWAASAGTLQPAALLLGALMYAWQFPHFCALSWNLQPDYSRAGFRMMSVIAPALCKRTSLRYSVALTAICLSAPYFDLTTWTFAADSLPLNAYLVYLAWRFYRDGDSNSSRKLFRFSLVHLPALLVLMLISKKHFGSRETTTSTSTVVE